MARNCRSCGQSAHHGKGLCGPCYSRLRHDAGRIRRRADGVLARYYSMRVRGAVTATTAADGAVLLAVNWRVDPHVLAFAFTRAGHRVLHTPTGLAIYQPARENKLRGAA